MKNFIWDILTIPLEIVSNGALRRKGVEVKRGYASIGWDVYHEDIFQKAFFLKSSAYVFAFDLVKELKND